MAARRKDLHAAPAPRARRPEPADWSHLRLTDRIRPRLSVLFVGINPGVRSALTGHHFAGYSNRFWKLLYESGLLPELIASEQDARLLEFGFGVTNLVARPSPGIDDLRPAEYVEGWRILHGKIRRYRPRIVALVGVTLYRAIVPLLVDHEGGAPVRQVAAALKSRRIVPGLQAETVHGAGMFVLPNPSGRNANFTYAEMLAAFRGLRKAVDRAGPEGRPGRKAPVRS
jgi:TDG/mug DNA glycosylase family protein